MAEVLARRGGSRCGLLEEIAPEFKLFFEVSKVFVGHDIVLDVFITEHSLVVCIIRLGVRVVALLLSSFGSFLSLFHLFVPLLSHFSQVT